MRHSLTLIGTPLLLMACESCASGGNADNLTQAQAQQVGNAAFADISQPLVSALGNETVPLEIRSRDNLRTALKRDTQTDAVAKPETVSCTGSNCTVSGNYNCPDSGSIAVSGNFSANSTGNGANATITAMPSNCSDGTLVLNGNSDITAGLQERDNGIVTIVNITIGGDVSFSPVQAGKFPTGSCSCNLTALVDVNDMTGSVTACSVTGTVCGQTVSAPCSHKR